MLPVDDDRIRGRFVPVTAALLVTASTVNRLKTIESNPKLGKMMFLPAHDFVSEEDPAHFRILVLTLIDDGLKQ